MNESQLGAWGEHLVIAELLQRGFYVATPVVDVAGHDVLATIDDLPYQRIQVKTCRQPSQQNGTSGYRFNARSTKGSDFYILCCVFHRSFYVIPTSEMKVTASLTGDGSGSSKLEKYFQAFHMLTSSKKTS